MGEYSCAPMGVWPSPVTNLSFCSGELCQLLLLNLRGAEVCQQFKEAPPGDALYVQVVCGQPPASAGTGQGRQKRRGCRVSGCDM